MSRYEDLAKELSSQSAAMDAYWDGLIDSVRAIRGSLYEYLGLLDRGYEDPERGIQPYIDIGIIRHGEFERVNPLQLPRRDAESSLGFTIKLAIVDARGELGEALTNLTVRRPSGQLHVILEHSGQQLNVYGDEYAAVAEAIYNSISSVLKARP